MFPQRSTPIQFSNDVPVEKREAPHHNIGYVDYNDEMDDEEYSERREEDLTAESDNPHQRFHTIPMEEVPYADEGVKVYDHGGVFHDRFTVIFPDNTLYCMSSNAMQPNGTCRYAGMKSQVPKDQEALMERFCPEKGRFDKLRIDPPVLVDIVPLEVAEAIRRTMPARKAV